MRRSTARLRRHSYLKSGCAGTTMYVLMAGSSFTVVRAVTLSLVLAGGNILLVCTIQASASDRSRTPGIKLHLPTRLVISTLNRCPFCGITRYAILIMLASIGTIATRAFKDCSPDGNPMFIWLVLPRNVGDRSFVVANESPSVGYATVCFAPTHSQAPAAHSGNSSEQHSNSYPRTLREILALIQR